MGKKRKPNGDETFENFDPIQSGAMQEFEDFDVMKEPDSAQLGLTAQALGGIVASEADVKSLTQARQELESRYLIEPSQKLIAVAADGAAGFGNITGVGIGEKEVSGISQGYPAIVVYVKEKLSAPEISAQAFVPESVGGVPVDVQVTGELWASSYTQRIPPAPCGSSIGNCTRIMAGTLGCLVTRQNQLFILSNNHVIALVNTSPLNAAIPHPGRLDGGICPDHTIARLTQFVPINFAAGSTNLVDAAIGQTNPLMVDRRVLRPGGIRQSFQAPIVSPQMNLQMQKSGRTTQFRRGVINAIDATVDVSYAPLGGVARFTNQFGIKGDNNVPFSDRGDSGSLVTTFPGNNPVGLLFSGNAAANVTFCNDIQRVLAALSVSIVF
jgi:hypothetical protein